jgi:putative transposase
MSDAAPCYKRHRFPPAVIAHAVWLYLRFSLSLRAVEEMLLERGVEVSYESLRRWVAKFGLVIARGLRRRQARPSRVWHLDEVQATIRGRRFWLGRAVDEHGTVLEEMLQPRRDRKAAKRRLLKKVGGPPRRIVTDKLASYSTAKREVAPTLEHRAHKGLNNRAENSHLPFRSRERMTRGHRSPGGLQRFVSMRSATRNRLVPPPCRRSAQTIRYHRLEALDVRHEVAGLAS